MHVREAKDFLVSEIKKQADIESVSLPEPEIQMLYFSEQSGLSTKMPEAVDNFDDNCDTALYEKKIANLMKHAYKRLKKEDSPEKITWDAAIRCLRKGDHYILVIWGGGFSPSPIKPLIFLGLVSFAMMMLASLNWVTKKLQPPDPHTLQIAFVACIVLGYLLRRRLTEALNFLIDRTVLRWFKSEDERKESRFIP